MLRLDYKPIVYIRLFFFTMSFIIFLCHLISFHHPKSDTNVSAVSASSLLPGALTKFSAQLPAKLCIIISSIKSQSMLLKESIRSCTATGPSCSKSWAKTWIIKKQIKPYLTLKNLTGTTSPTTTSIPKTKRCTTCMIFRTYSLVTRRCWSGEWGNNRLLFIYQGVPLSKLRVAPFRSSLTLRAVHRVLQAAHAAGINLC